MPNAEFARELDPHRGYLLRVARLQLRDEALAEDVVQETLLAALSGSGFSGKSSLRTARASSGRSAFCAAQCKSPGNKHPCRSLRRRDGPPCS